MKKETPLTSSLPIKRNRLPNILQDGEAKVWPEHVENLEANLCMKYTTVDCVTYAAAYILYVDRIRFTFDFPAHLPKVG